MIRRRQAFPRRHRVRRRREFLRVQSKGRKHHTRHFLVFVRRRDDRDAPTRLGITVTRKVANAVGRNRIKRWVREAFRRETFAPGFDLVWVAKRDAAATDYAEVVAQMHDVAMTLRDGGRGSR